MYTRSRHVHYKVKVEIKKARKGWMKMEKIKLVKANPERCEELSYTVIQDETYRAYPFFSFTKTAPKDFIAINEEVFSAYLRDLGCMDYDVAPHGGRLTEQDELIDVEQEHVNIDMAIRTGFGVIKDGSKLYLYDIEQPPTKDQEYRDLLTEQLIMYFFLTEGRYKETVRSFYETNYYNALLFTGDRSLVEQIIIDRLQQ